MLEIIADGKPKTEFMKYGDCVSIEMLDSKGQSVFGEIKQQVQPYRN
jgi:fumarylacetoacetate (FAA) hydrolase